MPGPMALGRVLELSRLEAVALAAKSKGLPAALHYIVDHFLDGAAVNAATILDVANPRLHAEDCNHLGVSVHRDVRVVGRHDDLPLELAPSKQTDHDVVHVAVVYVVLGLIDDQRLV